MFTDPPLARVGLSEGEAEHQGVSVRVAGALMVAAKVRRSVFAGKLTR
jgi:pyruvate/2-oxoglutarate dehydrogenase complex dihydrolipoamide dehydrogenase (E3) component